RSITSFSNHVIRDAPQPGRREQSVARDGRSIDRGEAEVRGGDRTAFPYSSIEEIIKKTLREVRAMAQLDQPNIIRYNSTWIERPPDD
ncbi:hypothetical protein PENTCL1PPCAC_8560, partial [Pristionchus entomophagus]